MRFIHFSDTHLGFSEYGRVDEHRGINIREQDAYLAFERVVDAVLDRRPDFVIHAGDLFHTPRPSNRAITCAMSGFARILDKGIPVAVIAGNHSTPRLAASGSIFEALTVIGVSAAHGNRTKTFRFGDAALCCVPHTATDDLLRAALAEAAPDVSAKYNILVLHGAVRNQKGRDSLGEFNEVVFDREALSNLDAFDYIALGHYHRSLQVAPNAWYSGSTERFHLREAGYEKGYLEVDLARGDVAFTALPCREIRILPPLNAEGMNGADLTGAVEEALTKDAAGVVCKLEVEGVSPAAWVELDRYRVRAAAGDVLHLHLEPRFANTPGTVAATTAIGALSVEFAAYLSRAETHGFDPARLGRMGEEYLGEKE
jgi:DNA repair exonuclease SbcCD nuclease subunit